MMAPRPAPPPPTAASPALPAPAASARRTVALEAAGLAALGEALGDAGGLGGAFARAVALLLRASDARVVVTGMGKSGHVARKLAATLASTGSPAAFVHPAEASHGDLGMIRPGDAVVALSWSGETAELAAIVAYARRFRVPLVAITAGEGSALALAADVALVLPRAEEACPNGLAPTTSTAMQLALGDALAVALLEARGFGPGDFRVFHPGGKLGAALTRVGDLMHAGDALPLVPLSASTGEAIVAMSAKGFGCAAVVDEGGRLAGIVTDGDLRRHMAPDLAARPVAGVMTREPRTARPMMLAPEALELANAAKITALVVVDEGNRAVGIVHLHDLLRAGAA